MGNCVRSFKRCFFVDDLPDYDFPIENLRHPRFISSSNISFESSFTHSTLNEPSILSFKNGSKSNHVYIDSDVCVICLEKYDDIKHNPMILPCGHMFCRVCLRILAKKGRYRSMKCPIDRMKHDIKSKKDYSDYLTRDINVNIHMHTTNTSTQTVDRSIASSDITDLQFEEQQSQIIQLRLQSLEYVDGWLSSVNARLPHFSSQIETLDSIQHNFSLDTNRPEPPPDYSSISSVPSLTTSFLNSDCSISN